MTVSTEEAHYRDVLKTSPESVPAHLGLVGALLDRRRFDEARAQIKALRDVVAPGEATLRKAVGVKIVGLAQILGARGLLEAAEIIGWEAMSFDEASPNIWFLRGLIAKEMGHYEEAAKRCERALDLEPNHGDAAFLLASAKAQLGRHEEAAARFDALLARHPGYPGARERLGDQMAALGRAEEALAHYGAVPVTEDRERGRLARKQAAMELAQGHADLAWNRVAAFHAEGGDGENLVFKLGLDLPKFCRTMRAEMVAPDVGAYVRFGGDEVTDQPFIAALDGGGVLGRSNIPVAEGRFFTTGVLHSDFKVLTYEADQHYDSVVASCRDRLLCRVTGRRHVAGEYLLIGGFPNPGHWLFNHFARLMMVEGLARFAHMPLAVSGGLSPRMYETLHRAGYGEDKIFLLEQSVLTTFDRLWVPSMPMFGRQGPLYWAPGLLDFIRRALRVPEGAQGRRRRFYIPRSGARWRRLLNEDELTAALAPLGVEVIDPAVMTVDEQIAAVQDAELLIGPFGAGMNLLMFAPRDCRVVELKNGNTPMDINPAFCRALGQTHKAVSASWVDEAYGTRLDADFRVDVAEVLAAIVA